MEHHNTKSSANKEHGTTRSYIIGFILSLIFTIIPYYLVVNKTFAGSTLLVIILGIAVLQMAIQLLFFLHLGRGPKPLYNVVFFFATAGVIVITVGASLFIMDNLYRNMSPDEVIRRQAQEENISQIGGEETGACKVARDNHVITISHGRVRPLHTEAERCDSLTFINEDDQEREIVFGVYPKNTGYGGIFEVPLKNGRPETVTLNEAGDFNFYDHHSPEATGSFTVTQ